MRTINCATHKGYDGLDSVPCRVIEGNRDLRQEDRGLRRNGTRRMRESSGKTDDSLGAPIATVSRMLYRKSSPSPPRLLLRIVATAGAGALVGGAACSSSEPTGPCGGGPCGTVVLVPDSGLDASTPEAQSADAAAEAEAGYLTGVVPDGPGPSVDGPSGSVPAYDAGDSGEPEAGTVVGLVRKPDAEAESGPCGGGPCGSVVMPHDAGVAE